MDLPHRWILLLFVLIGFQVNAQVALPKEMSKKMERMGLNIAVPAEKTFKHKRIRLNDYMIADYIIRLRKKKVEIQYKFIPETAASFVPPHVQYFNLLNSLASNDPETSLIAVHNITQYALSSNYHADWGSIAYFEPKISFSSYRYAKLVSLYKSGKGMVYMLFLFNKPEADNDLNYFEAKFDQEFNTERSKK